MPEQSVGRPGEMPLGHALGPAHHDAGHVERHAEVAELRALTGGRADLPSEVTGIFEGTSECEFDEPLATQATS